MPYEQIDAQLSAADAQAVKDALATIQQKLPFLGTLTVTERKQLSKAGAEHLSFIEGSGQVALNNPAILPATFNGANFQNSVSLFSTMTDINTVMQQVARSVEDTHMMIGVYARAQASDVYHYAQAAAKKTPGLQPVVDQLGALNQKAVAAKRANKKTETAVTATAK